MEKWTLDTQRAQHVLIHYCEAARASDSNDILRQDIGGGYVRCTRCGEKFLPTQEPGNPRLLLRLQLNEFALPVPD
ncbi:MAG TPA: hypothetical protein VKU00_09980 [Chthonomonadaceae bacterium]|nr:hypothetical protein [Chthonomonadaceae bacterium]